MIFKVCLWKLQKLAFIAALDLVTQETLKGMIILLYIHCVSFMLHNWSQWKRFVEIKINLLWNILYLEEMFSGINWSYLSYLIELQNRRYERKRRTTANPLYNFEPEVIFSCCIIKNLGGKFGYIEYMCWYLVNIYREKGHRVWCWLPLYQIQPMERGDEVWGTR